jgi:hypothetical protein
MTTAETILARDGEVMSLLWVGRACAAAGLCRYTFGPRKGSDCVGSRSKSGQHHKIIAMHDLMRKTIR